MDADLGIMQSYQKKTYFFYFVKTFVLYMQIAKVWDLNSVSTIAPSLVVYEGQWNKTSINLSWDSCV